MIYTKIKIADMLNDKNISAYELATRLDLSKPYVNSLKLENKGSLNTLAKICLALEYSHKKTAQIIINELDLDVDLSSV